MNDDLKSRLVKYLDLLEEAGKAGGKFVAKEAPETVRQFLRWEIVGGAMSAVLCFTGSLLLSALCWWLGYLAAEAGHGPSAPPCWMGCIFSAIPAVILVIAGICDVFAVAKVFIAPNVFLIEKAAKLLGEANE